MILENPHINKRHCTVLWDTGAQILSITNQYAKEKGFKDQLASIQVAGVGSESSKKSKIQQKMSITDEDRWITDKVQAILC
jgi:hypothetical protein